MHDIFQDIICIFYNKIDKRTSILLIVEFDGEGVFSLKTTCFIQMIEEGIRDIGYKRHIEIVNR